MSASFNEICQRLGCEVEDGHWARSAEAPDGTRIVFAVRGDQIDWNTGTCVLFPASTAADTDSIRGTSDPVLFGKYHAELCAMDPAIEAFGVVCKPGDSTGRSSVDAERVLRLRVERKDDGGYVGHIAEQLPLTSVARG